MVVWQFTTIAVLIGALLVYVMLLTNRLGATNAMLKRIEEALVRSQPSTGNIPASPPEPTFTAAPVAAREMDAARPAPIVSAAARAIYATTDRIQARILEADAEEARATYAGAGAARAREAREETSPPEIPEMLRVRDVPDASDMRERDRRVSYLTVRDLKVIARSGRRSSDATMGPSPLFNEVFGRKHGQTEPELLPQEGAPSSAAVVEELATATHEIRDFLESTPAPAVAPTDHVVTTPTSLLEPSIAAVEPAPQIEAFNSAHPTAPPATPSEPARELFAAATEPAATPDELFAATTAPAATPDELFAATTERAATPAEMFAAATERAATPDELFAAAAERAATPADMFAAATEPAAAPGEMFAGTTEPASPLAEVLHLGMKPEAVELFVVTPEPAAGPVMFTTTTEPLVTTAEPPVEVFEVITAPAPAPLREAFEAIAEPAAAPPVEALVITDEPAVYAIEPPAPPSQPDIVAANEEAPAEASDVSAAAAAAEAAANEAALEEKRKRDLLMHARRRRRMR